MITNEAVQERVRSRLPQKVSVKNGLLTWKDQFAQAEAPLASRPKHAMIGRSRTL